MCPAKSSAFIVPYHPSLKMLLKSLVYLGVLMETQSTTPVRMFEVRHVMLRLKGGAGRENGNAPDRVASFVAHNNLKRDKSALWYEGYKAGRMQFLQMGYVPDQRDGKPLVVGLAGGTGSGKTTIKDTILQQLSQEGGGGCTGTYKDNVAVLSHDNYYRHRPELSDNQRELINFDHPDSLETDLMVQHLKELLAGNAVECPIYDFGTHLRKQNETIRVEPRPIILCEGILIFCDKDLRENMDLRIYVDVEHSCAVAHTQADRRILQRIIKLEEYVADRRILRRIERDLVQRGRTFASIVTQYLDTVKPMHDRFVEPSKQHADLIVPFGGRNIMAIQVLLEKLKAHLRNNFAYHNAQTVHNQNITVDEDGEVMLTTSLNTPVYHSQRTSDDIQLPHEQGK